MDERPTTHDHEQHVREVIPPGGDPAERVIDRVGGRGERAVGEHLREVVPGVDVHHREGHRVPVLVRISPLRDAAGVILGAVELFSDNSARKAIDAGVEDASLWDTWGVILYRLGRYEESQKALEKSLPRGCLSASLAYALAKVGSAVRCEY